MTRVCSLVAAAALALAAPATVAFPAVATPPVTNPRMEVAFVLDTTGSMSAMIADAKLHIWTIANKLKSARPTPEIRFGLVGYRDFGDEYVTRVHDLTTNLDALYQQLHAFVADGGGDAPEAVATALHDAVHKLQWSEAPEVLRAIFLIGDAPPHDGRPQEVPCSTTSQIAAERGILINTLQCGGDPHTRLVWREIAQRSSGAYATISHHGGTVDRATEFDADILGLNHALTATIIPYGSAAEHTNAARHEELMKVMAVGVVADRSSYLAKDSGGAVLAGGGDLVAELIAGRITLDAINPRLLEPTLARKPRSERHAYIERQVAQRRALLGELHKLAARREAAVARMLGTASGGEETLVLSAFEVMTKAAEARGFRFEEPAP